MNWFIERLKEASTWRGLSLLLGVAGVAVDPDLVMEIGMAVGTLVGAFEVIRKEKTNG